MAKGISIEVKGLDKIKKKLGEIPQTVRDETDAILASIGNEFVNRAVEDAPVDQGILKNQITLEKEGEMKWRVVSGAGWSAYIEFGTKSRVQVPPDLATYAAQFKNGGAKTPGKGFYDSILGWVKRKGIVIPPKGATRVDKQIQVEQTAFAIYLSIIRHGVKAHPFFFKQLPQAQVDINKRLDQMVKKILEA